MLVFIKSAIRFATIFLFGSTGETITEKSGHLNLGTPGIMCLGALGGCIGASLYMESLGINAEIINQTEQVAAAAANINGFAAILLCILFAMIFAGAGGLIYGCLTITLRCNQNVTGLAITIFGSGLCLFIGEALKASDKFPAYTTEFYAEITSGVSLARRLA